MKIIETFSAHILLLKKFNCIKKLNLFDLHSNLDATGSAVRKGNENEK